MTIDLDKLRKEADTAAQIVNDKNNEEAAQLFDIGKIKEITKELEKASVPMEDIQKLELEITKSSNKNEAILKILNGESTIARILKGILLKR